MFAVFLYEPERQRIAKFTLPYGNIIRVIFALFWFTQFSLVSIQKAESVLAKNTNAGIFKLLSVIYFQNMGIVICDF